MCVSICMFYILYIYYYISIYIYVYVMYDISIYIYIISHMFAMIVLFPTMHYTYECVWRSGMILS